MKARRQKKILEIISKEIISTQEELAEALEKAGFQVAQATVSRDIRELHLVKIATPDNRYRYGLPKEQGVIRKDQRLRRMMQDVVIRVDGSANVVVVKTYPGNAQALAMLIDLAEWPEIIGSVAGDDTILLIVRTPEDSQLHPETAGLIARLESLRE